MPKFFEKSESRAETLIEGGGLSEETRNRRKHVIESFENFLSN